MDAPALPANAACPRCGGAFRCGARDPAPCACAGLKLDAATLARARREFDGCLCLACLRDLQREADGLPPRATIA